MDGKGGSMEIKEKLDVERVMVGGKSCILHSNCDGEQPKVVFLQLTARHEAKSLPDELTMLDEGITRPYLFVGIELDSWARCLMPWFDDAVSRDEEVGKHASDTLCYIESTLVPWLHSRYGDVPCVIGGYSLGGLFALWASCKTDLFVGVAAVSPSVWIKSWTVFAENNPTHAKRVYLSLGDREEHARNQRMAAVGPCIRRQHELLLQQLSAEHTVLEWNKGGHFDDEAGRMARGVVWNVDC